MLEVSGPAAADPTELETIAHLSLQVGRLLQQNGADSAMVEAAVVRFAAAFGCEAHLMASYEALLLTIVAGDRFRTKIGHRVPAMAVGMSAVQALNALVDAVVGRRIGLTEAAAALEAIERQPPIYGKWLVILALGLTAASLSRLFGGDWPTFGVAWLAGAAATWLRLELGRLRVNPVAIPLAAACFGGGIGGLGVLLGASGTPALCLVAPGMILVPGVPLINGVQELIENRMTVAVSRLCFAVLVTIAIAFGLFVATVATGVSIPVEAPARTISVPEDGAFSALAALGYALLFSVPPRLAWACVLCGAVSHGLRTIGVQSGIDLSAGTLLGALAAGCMAQGFAWRFGAPAATFAFPGVVAMVPGAYAFRAVVGSLQIAGGGATPQLTDEILALGLIVLLVIGAIAVGLGLPAMLFSRLRVGGADMETIADERR